MVKALLSLLSVVLITICLVGCQASPNLASIQVTPNTATLTYTGQTVQLKAIGQYVHTGHPGNTQDITSQVTWASSNTSVSTVSSSGLATATGVGSTTISATLRDSGNSVVGSATLTSASGQPPHALQSIAVIPGSQPIVYLDESAQFIAIGTYNTEPLTVDITNQVIWQSSDVRVATVNAAGLAISNDLGQTTITAIGKSNTGADITGSSNLQVGSGTVTGSDGLINCATGGASSATCTANYVVGTVVTLTATPAPGSTFGGWSSNCIPDTATSCSIIMNNNEPIGAIFNTTN